MMMMMMNLGRGSIDCREQGSLEAENLQPNTPRGEWRNENDDDDDDDDDEDDDDDDDDNDDDDDDDNDDDDDDRHAAVSSI